MKGSFTVYYEDPFWVGIFEEEDAGGYSCCRVVFGNEPSGPELFEFIRKRYSSLNFTSVPVQEHTEEKKINPKRIARQINRLMEGSVRLNKAYEVIQKGYESRKIEKQQESKKRRDEKLDLKFRLKSEKRKKKHDGH